MERTVCAVKRSKWGLHIKHSSSSVTVLIQKKLEHQLALSLGGRRKELGLRDHLRK